MLDRKKLMERAESASRKSKHLEFKREFEVASGQAWCELIKDIVAIANSGGGIIIIGVANDGSNAAFDASVLLAHDTADIANRIARYTGNQLIDIEVMEIKRNGQDRAAIFVSDIDVPIVFTKPGTYDIGGGATKNGLCTRDNIFSTWKQERTWQPRRSSELARP